MRLLVPACMALTTAACANYGWAARPGPQVIDGPVYVQTVDVDADAGADPSLLTRDFVEQLQRSGAPGAQWSAATQRSSVVCDVAFPRQEFFGERSFVTASARCTVDGVVAGPREGQAQLAFQPSDRTVGRQRAFELAGRRALEAVAYDVVHQLAED